MIKTYKDWEGDLRDYLRVGNIVDEEMYEYFLDVMPPETNTETVVQIGEPYSHVNGKATYNTLEKSKEGWVYRGVCYSGKTINVG